MRIFRALAVSLLALTLALAQKQTIPQPQSGIVGYQVNSAPFIQFGSGAPTAVACVLPGLDQYYDASGHTWYGCTSAGVTGTWVQTSGASMAWPGSAGIAVYAGGSAWGTSLTFETTLQNPDTDTNVASGKAVRSAITAATSGLISNPMSSAADMIVGGSGGTPARLATPGNGTWCFNVSSGVASWTVCPGTPGSGISSISLIMPSWLSVSPGTLTANGTFTVTAQTGQTPHQVIGTCGSATSFAPCLLQASDIPALSYASPTATLTANGQSCALAGTCDVNAGAAAHSVAINEGPGVAIGGATVGTGGRILIDQGGSSDPSFNVVSGDATMSAAGVVAVVKVNGNTPGGSCINKAVTAIDSSGRPACSTLGSAYVDSSIATTGVDINSLSQVVGQHFSSPLPKSVGGIGADASSMTFPSSGQIPFVVAYGSQPLSTLAIASMARNVTTASAPGVVSTDTINWNANGSLFAVTGYAPSANGNLDIQAYPGSGTVSFEVTNRTPVSITPGAVTINWQVIRHP